MGKQRNTLGKLLSKSSATCALPCILSEKALTGARRKGSLLFNASLVTLSRLPKVLTKTIAKCSENGHPEPSGFTEPAGRAWILWKDSLGTLGSRILIVSPVRCSLLIVERCNKSGRYLASKRSCAISASQPPRRKWELVWSGSQKPRNPEFPSMTEMLGRVEEDPQSRTLAFFRVLTRTPSVGECTRSMHSTDLRIFNSGGETQVQVAALSMPTSQIWKRYPNSARICGRTQEHPGNFQSASRDTMIRLKLSTNSSCTYMLQFLTREGTPVVPSRAKRPSQSTKDTKTVNKP